MPPADKGPIKRTPPKAFRSKPKRKKFLEKGKKLPPGVNRHIPETPLQLPDKGKRKGNNLIPGRNQKA